jgi:two-component system OmpR family sensor kinase
VRSIRTRLLISFLAVAIAAAAGLSYYFLTNIEAYGLRRLEERLDTEARLSAALLAMDYQAAPKTGEARLTPQQAQRVSAALTEASAQTATELMVVDGAGTVIADSSPTSAVGSSYASRPEIAKALAGTYGAATRHSPNGRVQLYIAAPVIVGGRIVGATYATSTTFSIVTLLSDYRRELGVVILVFIVASWALTELLTRWLTRPLRRLQTGAQVLASDHSVRVRPEGPREVRAIADAFNQLAEEIETSSVELHEEERRKSRFVSDVSHELRTPLTAIRGAAETLLEGDVPEEDAQRFLRRIVSEADRLARLANDLLNLQRIEGATGELPLSRVSLRQVAKLAVESLEPLADDRGVKVVVQGDASAVLGDRDRLQQVVANLVDNASRMTPAGGTVTVALASDGDRALLSVLDEGPGIPEADRPRLFDRFYRAQLSRDRSTGGAGLGLAIVKAIVTAHAGELEVANRPEGGARFTVRLPSLPDR